jgi:hypothetical protein
MVEFIIKIVIPFLCTILTIYVIPLLKQKKLYDAVVIAVNAAEQIYKQSGMGKMGKEKFEYVKEWIKKKFKVSDEDLKNIIESAVYELNKHKE